MKSGQCVKISRILNSKYFKTKCSTKQKQQIWFYQPVEKTNRSPFPELATNWMLYHIIPFWHLGHSLCVVRQISWNEVKHTQSGETQVCLLLCLRRFVSRVLVTVMAAFGALIKRLKSYSTHCFVMLSLHPEDESLHCKSLSPILRDEHRTSELHWPSACETSFCLAVFCCVLA